MSSEPDQPVDNPKPRPRTKGQTCIFGPHLVWTGSTWKLHPSAFKHWLALSGSKGGHERTIPLTARILDALSSAQPRSDVWRGPQVLGHLHITPLARRSP